MLFSTFIGTIYYNCRDNQNKNSYHGCGQNKKNTKKHLQSVKKLISKKNSFFKETSNMICITNRMTGFFMMQVK